MTRTTGSGDDRTRLGPLETAVMDVLWRAADDLDVDAVRAQLAPTRRPVRNTVQSTLERLVRKGLAQRRKAGRAFRYAATLERRDWVALVIRALTDALRTDPEPDVLAGFVDFTERASPEALATLERIVSERRRARETDDEGSKS